MKSEDSWERGSLISDCVYTGVIFSSSHCIVVLALVCFNFFAIFFCILNIFCIYFLHTAQKGVQGCKSYSSQAQLQCDYESIE